MGDSTPHRHYIIKGGTHDRLDRGMCKGYTPLGKIEEEERESERERQRERQREREREKKKRERVEKRMI